MKLSLFNKILVYFILPLSMLAVIPVVFCFHKSNQLVVVPDRVHTVLLENRNIHTSLIAAGISDLRNPFNQNLTPTSGPPTTIPAEELQEPIEGIGLTQLHSHHLIFPMQIGLMHAYINEQPDDQNFIRDSCLYVFFEMEVDNDSREGREAREAQKRLIKPIFLKSKKRTIDELISIVTSTLKNRYQGGIFQLARTPTEAVKAQLESLPLNKLVVVINGQIQIALIRTLPTQPRRYQAVLATGIGIETSDVAVLSTAFDTVSQYFLH